MQYLPYNEDQIERECERLTDRLDRQFMSGAITEQQYNVAMRRLNNWVEEQYEAIK